MKKLLIFLVFILMISCKKDNSGQIPDDQITLERISYYQYPVSQEDSAFQYKLTYYFDNGKPHRWMLLDANRRVMTDYIYEYDSIWKHTGARYREDGAVNFSIEKVRFENDSTMITEWVDSLGAVYYTMIDNLNPDKKTYRAQFIGDKLHGYDSTFYTKEGFEKRIFFTNTKGKVFNDRTFNYDSVNPKGDWIVRTKTMQDTIRELHKREVYYDQDFVSKGDRFYEGIVSTGEFSENVINFSADESVLFLTRTLDWKNQAAYIANKKSGLFTETMLINELDSIYNGAISPNADKIIYSTRGEDQQNIWLITKENGLWSDKINLTQESKIEGGYFYWLNDQEICFYHTINNGDIVFGELIEGQLRIKDSLRSLNTSKGTEFSPFVDTKKKYIIFTRYEEGNESNQGFFVSYNQGDYNHPVWSKPKKLTMLPYGWSANIINDGTQFIYSNGEDILSIPVKELQLGIDY